MLNKIFIISLIFTSSISLFASNDGAIIHGQKHFFSIAMPAGWVFNKKACQEYGLPHLIQPKDRINEIQTCIYANGFDRKEGSNLTINDFIRDEQISFKNKAPFVKINKLNITFSNIQKTKLLSGNYCIYELTGFPNKYKELIIYIDAIETVCTIVFSTKTEEDYNKYYQDYISIVKSFRFLGRNVNTNIK